MRIRAGTSGWSYKEWKGSFYPEDLPASRMLSYYAERLGTVEINNTFYRMPTEKLLLGWEAQVPDGFSFVLKAPRRITHQKKLKDVGDELSHLVQISTVLGEKRGPTLFQLPPYAKKDMESLGGFLRLLPPVWQAALEFRNESWLDDEVLAALRAHGVALVVADVDGAAVPAIAPTARFGYLRLRRERYDREALAAWVDRIRSQPWDEAYVFFKHEDAGTGPRLAAEFTALL